MGKYVFQIGRLEILRCVAYWKHFTRVSHHLFKIEYKIFFLKLQMSVSERLLPKYIFVQ